jgi:hypothetical protein
MLRAFPVAGCGLALAACATNPADAQSSTPGRTAQVAEICRVTMGLNPANYDYEMCRLSLLQTVASLDRAELIARDRQVCAQRGLAPNTPAFSTCVVDAEMPVGN